MKLLAMDHSELVDLLALSAPAVKISEDISPFLQKISGVVSTLLPLLPVEKIDTALLSRDQEVVDDYNADPLVYHGGISARSGHSLLSSERLILARAQALNTPVLLQHGSADGLADPAGSTRLHAGASSADKTLKMYEGFYHEIFNEPEQAQVRADLLSWLDQRLPARD